MPAIEYRHTLELLQHKLIMKFRLNEKLNENIYYKSKFIDNTERGIIFNLAELSELYLLINVEPDFEKYCLSFIEFIKPVLLDFLSEVNYGGITFRTIFRYKGEKWEKVFTVLNTPQDE